MTNKMVPEHWETENVQMSKRETETENVQRTTHIWASNNVPANHQSQTNNTTMHSHEKYSHGAEHLADEHLRPLSDQQQQLNSSGSSVSLMCACFLNESLRDLNNHRTLPQLDNNDSSSTGSLFFDRNNHSYPLDSSIDISECFFVGKFILNSHWAHKSIDSFFGLDNAT